MLRLAASAMGTRFEIVLEGTDERRLRAAGEAALAEIEECDQRLSLFRSDSLLAHVQRTAATSPVALDEDTFALFEDCAALHELSTGTFDVTVAPLMRAHGFRGESDRQPWMKLEDHVRLVKDDVGGGHVVLDRVARTVSFTRPEVGLDLGAIAKGHALELAARTLREAGVTRALLHGGTSSVIAIGAPPGQPGWRVEVEGGEDAPVAQLRDAALSVSAPHGRRNRGGSGHILDPRTGKPTEVERVACALHVSARIAEGWSTAMVVLGELPAAARGVCAVIGEGRRGARAWRNFGSSSDRHGFVRDPPRSLSA